MLLSYNDSPLYLYYNYYIIITIKILTVWLSIIRLY